MNMDIRVSTPSFKKEKFKEILLYVLTQVRSKPNVGETVLYKLLYFIDFDFYEKYEEQLTGVTYIKNKHGPTPREFKKVLGQMEANKELFTEKTEYHNRPQTKYIPSRSPNLSVLETREIEVINQVLRRLSDEWY
jgi:hypothetical protein